MKVGVIGSGQVGRVLADSFLEHGHSVMCASRDPSKLDASRRAAGERAAVGTFPEAVEWAELVVLAVKGRGGASTAACAIEPLCMLWCIPGLLRDDWTRAYEVLRPRAEA